MYTVYIGGLLDMGGVYQGLRGAKPPHVPTENGMRHLGTVQQ